MPTRRCRIFTIFISVLVILVVYNFGEILIFHTKEILHHTGLYNKEAAFRRRAADCDDSHDAFTLIPEENCDNLLLLVLVESVVENAQARKAIREGFGKSTAEEDESGKLKKVEKWRLIFTVGISSEAENTAVEKESGVHRDILRWEFDDNLRALKSTLGFHWASCRCTASYVLQSRDDVFVNIRAFMSWLQHSTLDTSRIYTGVLTIGADLLSNKNSSSHNTIEEEDYHSLRFIRQPTCLLSIDVVDRVMHYLPRVKVSRLPPDAYIGVLVRKTGTRSLDDRKFKVQNLQSELSPCVLKNTFFISAGTSEDHRKIFIKIEDSFKKCSDENRSGRRVQLVP